MGLLDRFLDAIKLNDDDYDDDEFLDDDLDDDYDDEPERKAKNRFFKRFGDDDDLDEEEAVYQPKTAAKPAKAAKSSADTPAKPRREKAAPARKSKVTPIRRKNTSNGMEVNVIRPVSMEDTRDIADTLVDLCTVVLNLEGLDVDTAQRIIDFTCGACYSLGGSLQKVSSYIFILTPDGVDISGDYEDILSGSFDLPSMKSPY